jgi:hypothetical protein
MGKEKLAGKSVKKVRMPRRQRRADTVLIAFVRAVQDGPTATDPHKAAKERNDIREMLLNNFSSISVWLFKQARARTQASDACGARLDAPACSPRRLTISAPTRSCRPRSWTPSSRR